MRAGFTLAVDPPHAEVFVRPPAEPGVEVWLDLDGSTAAIGFRRDDLYCIHVPPIGTFAFSAHGPEVRLTPLPDVPDDLVQDAFCRIVLPLASQLRGRQVLHASSVLTEGGVVALCGRSGAGKSTLAYGLSQSGSPLWGDDAVAFAGSELGLVVEPLPFRVRLRPESAEWFDDREHQKGFERSQPWTCGRSPQPFRALFVLDRLEPEAEAGTRIVRLSPADAFAAVLPHAYYLALSDRELNRSLLTAYLDLADRLPVLRLSYAPGLEAVVAITEAIRQTVDAL